MADYFANDPSPGGASQGSDYFSSDPVPGSNLEVVTPELTTDQGTSLIPVEGGDFFDLLSSYASRLGVANLPLESQAKMFEKEGSDSPPITTNEKLNKTIELFAKENNRIENVLQDKFGARYGGSDKVGDISLSVRDGLARRNKFADRLAYFKRIYPQGKYYRTDVGGGKTEELYQLTQDGDIFRVDPNGGFSDFKGDFGDFLGTVGTFSTAGAIAGSFWKPFLGTAGGSLVGQMIDDYLTGEDVNYENGREFFGDVLSGDKVKLAVFEGAVNSVLPGMGKYLVSKIEGTGGVPFGFATKKTASEALQAQKFAQRSGLPLLSIAQLTDNQIVKKLTNQLMGTSDLISKKMTKQNLKLYNKLKTEVEKDYNNVSQAELVNYLALSKKKLLDDTVEVIKQADPESQLGNISFDELVKDVGKFKEGYDTLIEKTYTLAMQTAKKDKVVFNLKDIQETAGTVLAGVQGKMAKPDKTGKNVYQRLGGELQGEIKNLLTQLRAMDPEVGTIAVEKFGKKRVFDSLKQMLTVRNKLSEIAGETGDRNAIEMIKAIDNTLEKPMSGGTNFMKYLKEAKQLTKDKNDIVNFTSLSSLFDKRAGLNVDKTMQSIFEGKTNAQDINLLAKFMQVAEGVNDKSSKQLIQKTTGKVMKDLQDGFVQYILNSGEKAGKTLFDLKVNKPDLYNKLVPHAPTRKALEDLSLKASQLQNSGAQQALKQAMENSENAFALLSNSTAKEVSDMVASKGGINSPFANDLRRAIINKVMTKSGIAEQAEGSGTIVINSAMFSKNMTDLTEGLGEFQSFKSLFPPKYVKALTDRRLYSFFITGGTKDAGASIATGAVVGQLRQGKPIEFGKTMLVSNVLSSILAKPPSVVQLQKVHDKFNAYQRRDKVFSGLTAMLTSLERELGIGLPLSPETGKQETIEEEVERTGETPVRGDQVSQNTTMSNTITPNTLNLNLPEVSGGGSSSSPPLKTNYASLFPFDTTGGAIQSRAGIGGLA